MHSDQACERHYDISSKIQYSKIKDVQYRTPFILYCHVKCFFSFDLQYSL